MKRSLACTTLFVAAIVGCGPSATELRERTLSALNTEADSWDGKKDFETTAKDAYGGPLSGSVDKGIISFTLEVRSNGPDGLPKNSDDIVVTRTRPHNETTYLNEAEKMAESVSRGMTSGTIKGVKKGLGIGADAEPKKQ